MRTPARACLGWSLITLTAMTACRNFPAEQGAALFVDSGQRLGNEASWGVALGDVDRDGDLDAVVVNFDAGAVVLTDLDGDGDLELFVACLSLPTQGWNYRPSANLVWLNTTLDWHESGCAPANPRSGTVNTEGGT